MLDVLPTEILVGKRWGLGKAIALALEALFESGVGCGDIVGFLLKVVACIVVILLIVAYGYKGYMQSKVRREDEEFISQLEQIYEKYYRPTNATV